MLVLVTVFGTAAGAVLVVGTVAAGVVHTGMSATGGAPGTGGSCYSTTGGELPSRYSSGSLVSDVCVQAFPKSIHMATDSTTWHLDMVRQGSRHLHNLTRDPLVCTCVVTIIPCIHMISNLKTTSMQVCQYLVTS